MVSDLHATTGKSLRLRTRQLCHSPSMKQKAQGAQLLFLLPSSTMYASFPPTSVVCHWVPPPETTSAESTWKGESLHSRMSRNGRACQVIHCTGPTHTSISRLLVCRTPRRHSGRDHRKMPRLLPPQRSS